MSDENDIRELETMIEKSKKLRKRLESIDVGDDSPIAIRLRELKEEMDK